MRLEKAFIALQNKIDRMARVSQTTMTKNYKKALNDLKISMARLYEQYEIEGQLTFDEMSKYNRLKILDKQVYDIVTELYSSNSKVIKGTLEGIVVTSYTHTFDIVQGSVVKKLKSIQKDMDVSKTVNEQMAGLKWTERMGKHRADVIYNIQKEVKYGLTKGDTYATMSKRLKKELEVDVKKSNLIIRTESNRVFNQTKLDSLEGISKQGVKFTKTWRSGQDERVRSTHNSLDGITISLDEDFVSTSGATGKGPGLMGSASEDCYCRCILVPGIITK